MRRSVFIGIIVLAAVLCIGVLFGVQSLGNNTKDASADQAQPQATTYPGYLDHAMIGLVIAGGVVFFIRPRRRVVDTTKSK